MADKTDLIHDDNADIVHSSERLSKRIRLFRLAFILTLILFILGATTILIMDLWIGLRYRSRLYTDIDTIPHRPVALVLGTAPEFQGRTNLFYRARLKAAAALFHAGKVDGLLLSGDNGHKDYNEPEHMKQDLIKLGVPAEFITLDYAGFRTLDSVVRAQAIFNLDTPWCHNHFIATAPSFFPIVCLKIIARSHSPPTTCEVMQARKSGFERLLLV